MTPNERLAEIIKRKCAGVTLVIESLCERASREAGDHHSWVYAPCRPEATADARAAVEGGA